MRSLLDKHGAGLSRNSWHHVVNNMKHGLYDDLEGREAEIYTTPQILAAGHCVRPDLRKTEPRPPVQQNADNLSSDPEWEWWPHFHPYCI